MNITEASKILGLSERTVRRAIKSGVLQAREFKGKHGKEYEINEQSLKAYTARKAEQPVIHTESGQSIATLDNGGTIDKSLSMESVATFLTQLNYFIGNLRALDSKENGSFDRLPDILTATEASAYLRIGPQEIRKLVRSGELKARKLGKGLKFSKFTLEKFRKKLLE